MRHLQPLCQPLVRVKGPGTGNFLQQNQIHFFRLDQLCERLEPFLHSTMTGPIVPEICAHNRHHTASLIRDGIRLTLQGHLSRRFSNGYGHFGKFRQSIMADPIQKAFDR